MKYPIALILLLLLSAASCKKNKKTDPLPPATQTGANTMGCYVNGVAWLPNTEPFGSIPGLKPINVDFLNNKSQLLMTFYRKKNPDDQTLEIFINAFNGVGIYMMDSSSKIIGIPGSYGPLNNYQYFADDKIKKSFVTDESHLGTVTITLYDSIKNIVSGTFQFKGNNLRNVTDSVVVSEGRFDVTLY